MKTLLERLKPEYLEILENKKKEYPATVELFEENLNSIYTWLHLTYGNLIYINHNFYVKININEIESLFYDYE